MTFFFRNRAIFWDILKWNRGQTKWDGGSNRKMLGILKKKISELLPQFASWWIMNSVGQMMGLDLYYL